MYCNVVFISGVIWGKGVMKNGEKQRLLHQLRRTIFGQKKIWSKKVVEIALFFNCYFTKKNIKMPLNGKKKLFLQFPTPSWEFRSLLHVGNVFHTPSWEFRSLLHVWNEFPHPVGNFIPYYMLGMNSLHPVGNFIPYCMLGMSSQRARRNGLLFIILRPGFT